MPCTSHKLWKKKMRRTLVYCRNSHWHHSRCDLCMAVQNEEGQPHSVFFCSDQNNINDMCMGRRKSTRRMSTARKQHRDRARLTEFFPNRPLAILLFRRIHALTLALPSRLQPPSTRLHPIHINTLLEPPLEPPQPARRLILLVHAVRLPRGAVPQRVVRHVPREPDHRPRRRRPVRERRAVRSYHALWEFRHHGHGELERAPFPDVCPSVR